jgi:hypothetical protein
MTKTENTPLEDILDHRSIGKGSLCHALCPAIETVKSTDDETTQSTPKGAVIYRTLEQLTQHHTKFADRLKTATSDQPSWYTLDLLREYYQTLRHISAPYHHSHRLTDPNSAASIVVGLVDKYRFQIVRRLHSYLNKEFLMSTIEAELNKPYE